MDLRAIAFWALSAVPVLAATISGRPEDFTATEAVLVLAGLGVGFLLVRRYPPGALVVVIVTWQIAFLARISDTSSLTPSFGVLLVAYLAGRYAGEARGTGATGGSGESGGSGDPTGSPSGNASVDEAGGDVGAGQAHGDGEVRDARGRPRTEPPDRLSGGSGVRDLTARIRALDPDQRCLLVLCAGILGSAIAGLLVTGAPDTGLAAATATGVLTLVPWLIGRHRRARAAWQTAGWEHAEALERNAELVEARARSDERAQLAAEMHDLIGHELAQAALRLGALELDTEHRHQQAAQEARQSVTAAAERLADVVRLLRSEPIPEAVSVADLVERSRSGGLSVEFEESGRPIDDPIIARTVHRVVAEALTNAIKYAPGATMTVRLRSDEDGTEVDVANDSRAGRAESGGDSGGSGGSGDGEPDLPSGERGLLGLAERVALVGGRFRAGPAPGGGFRVRAFVPHQASAPRESSGSRTRLRQQQARLRRSAWRTAVASGGIALAAAAVVVGYMVFDTTSSLLPARTYHELSIGQQRSEIAPRLPWRDRVDGPAGPVEPSGARCRYYSVRANPFAEHGSDLYRLCFSDGRLVEKRLIHR